MPSRLFEFDNPYANHPILVHDFSKPLVIHVRVVLIFMKCVERMVLFHTFKDEQKTRHKETKKCRSYLSSWWVIVDSTATLQPRKGKGLINKE